MWGLLTAAATKTEPETRIGVRRLLQIYDGGATTLARFVEKLGTLLGLFGTCTGMIHALSSMATATPDPARAMPGIAAALWTTCAGIVVYEALRQLRGA